MESLVEHASTTRKKLTWTLLTHRLRFFAPTTADIKSDINLGPVSVAIEADSFYFQFYGGGVVTDTTKCGITVDHAVDPVGYGTDETYSEY